MTGPPRKERAADAQDVATRETESRGNGSEQHADDARVVQLLRARTCRRRRSYVWPEPPGAKAFRDLAKLWGPPRRGRS
jgi:hypothetical protein